MSKGLTVTSVFEAMSLNYGEGIGNISELKKLSRSNEMLSYISRQALRYEIYRMLREMFSIDAGKEEPLTGDQNVIQFKPDATIKDYVEIDLFGYMKTKKGGKSLIRPAVVRITPAISLEPMFMDVEFGTNLNFAKRLDKDPNPFQLEHHYSLYSYTVVVELDKIGIDDDDKIELDNKERARRVSMLLEVLKLLSRNIKGRIETLSPLFAIGGVYDVKNPFFLNKIKVSFNKDDRKYSIDTDILKSTLDMSTLGNPIKDHTNIGIAEGYWHNEKDIKDLSANCYNINGFFEALKSQVNNYYGV